MQVAIRAVAVCLLLPFCLAVAQQKTPPQPTHNDAMHELLYAIGTCTACDGSDSSAHAYALHLSATDTARLIALSRAYREKVDKNWSHLPPGEDPKYGRDLLQAVVLKAFSADIQKQINDHVDANIKKHVKAQP